jgi:hypothetical protein
MARDDRVPSHYPCLMQKDGLRRVHEPRDEQPVVRTTPPRDGFKRLIVALRR